ncbi:MAG: gliding motility-associated C-terminal domain-containing protein [Ferruginibacter sp.]
MIRFLLFIHCMLTFCTVAPAIPDYGLHSCPHPEALLKSIDKDGTLNNKFIVSHSGKNSFSSGMADMGAADSCTTPTFYMRLSDGAGRKIELKELQTLPGGDFIAAGNITLSNGEKEGLVLRMTNGGTIVSQTQLRISNKPVTIFKMRVTSGGITTLAGILNDGTNAVFLSQLSADLSTNWVKSYPMPSPVIKLTLGLFDTSMALATQLSSSIVYTTLNANGAIIWNKTTSPAGLIGLGGFGSLGWSTLALTTNCLRNGKQVVEISEILKQDGNISSSHIINDGVQERTCFETGSFNQGANLLGSVKISPAGFELVRYKLYYSATIETEHRYKIAGNIDFNISGAMDIAGDALGFYLPRDGKMIFIRHFNYYQTTPEYTRQYTVPNGSGIAAIARSSDGGYLFGLNTLGSNEIILIKTDSIGILAGCGYQDIANDFHEIINQQNTAVATVAIDMAVAANLANSISSNANLTAQYNCNEHYCPALPVVDTCLATYYKTFRSHSHAESFGDYLLMRNNNQLIVSARYDRIWETENPLTYGLKLFDEIGQFIKGVSVYFDGITTAFSSLQMDDRSVMLISNSSQGNYQAYTFTLVSDNLEIIWSRTVKTNGLYSGGSGVSDVHKDAEGNYYFVATTLGFMEKPKVIVYKMDAAGNELWQKVYELDQGLFGSAKAVSTNTSLVVIIESNNPGSVTVTLDKKTGQMLNSFIYQNGYSGSSYRRLAKFDKGRIFYGGGDGQDKFLMGIFDTTGRPSKFRTIDHAGSVIRAGNVKAGMLYATYFYFNGSATKEVLLKADSNLDIKFINEYDFDIARIPQGLGIGTNDNIYVGGNFSSGGVNGSYFDPYIRKYNDKGELGTCNFTALDPPIIDINPNPQSLGYAELQSSIQQINNVTVSFVPDSIHQNVSAILCSSVVDCNSIKISGPATVCSLNTDYSYKSVKNSSCTLQPQWIYDTSFIKLAGNSDSVATVRFKKAGNTWLKVKLNAGCLVYYDSLQVQALQPNQSFNLGSDLYICPGDTTRLNAGAGFNTYTWQDGSTDSIFIANGAGTYFVKVSNSCGEIYADTIIISIASIPTLSIGSDQTVCRLDTILLQATAGFAKYNWLPASLISSQSAQVKIIPLQDELITLKVTTDDGCYAYDTISVNVISARPVFLGPDTAFCEYDSITLNAGAGYEKYFWNTGSDLHAVTIGTAGIYWVRARDINGCYANDSLEIQVFKQPIINLGNDINLCRGDQVKLDAGNFISYFWQDGSASRFFTTRDKGIYRVMVTDQNNCVAMDSMEVKNIFPLPSGFLIPEDSLCSYDKLTIRPTGSYTSYLWSTGSVQPSLLIDKPGNFILTVKDLNGCIGNDTIRVVQKDCFSGVFIPGAFSPDGNQVNDIFRAKVFGNVINFRLDVFNRYGELIFTTTNPQKGWDGNYKGKGANTGAFVWQCSWLLQGGIRGYEKGTVMLLR